MLSIKKLVHTTNYSLGYIFEKTIHRYTLKQSQILIAYNKYSSKYELQDSTHHNTTSQKLEIDDKVKALKEKLLYSDYIQSKKIGYGCKRGRIAEKRMAIKAKQERLAEFVAAPTYSIALKYLRNNVDELQPKVIEEQEEEVEDEQSVAANSTKPIHMPYAATDKYETLEVAENECNNVFPVLNQKYKAFYEEYLESKRSGDSQESLTEKVDDIEEEETLTDEITRKRPMASTNNVPPDWMTDYEQFNDADEDDYWDSNYGTPNPNSNISSIPCGGCGALLHCKDPAIPGYLPSELFENQKQEILQSSVCQRCHFMKNYNTALEVRVSPEEYPALLSHIKKKKVAVILMVDLTDFPCSIWPGIMNIIGKSTPVFVVGNKVDLLPCDGPNYLKHIEECLIQELKKKGVGKANIKAINLISAKTGYGVEQLINKLHKQWEYKGDVYMIGCTNVGKSTLFNALLGSDYCKVHARNLIQRATVSPWPGTTLNLLKFPILNPLRWRLYVRTQRLIAAREEEINDQLIGEDRFRNTRKIKYTALRGRIGATFASSLRTEGPGFFGVDTAANLTGYLGFNENDEIYKNSRWFFDTPGTIHPDQVLHFLTTEELMLTLPQEMISPRSFQIKPGQTLFLAGLGRLDLIKSSEGPIRYTVFASKELPVTICLSEEADALYQKLIRTDAFVVPIPDSERLKVFPALESKEFAITGQNKYESSADIVLSSAGWVAITAPEDVEIVVRAWTPEGKGIYLRSSALLRRSIKFRGQKLGRTPAFKRGKQIYTKN